MNADRSDADRCQHCGTPGAFGDGDGLCPGCLLETALAIDTNEDPEETPATRDSCGPYQIERMIGRGGNGMVFLARKPGSGRFVALKMLASARIAGPDAIRRFRLEAAAVAELEHPNIIRVLDSGEEDGTPWFAMNFAPGGSLADQLAAEPGPDAAREKLRQRVEIMARVAHAVHFAHERGILHRDIKPANILIDGDGSPLVADFGLARMIHNPVGVTMTGAALGTPAYMSPEQAAGVAVTTTSDVYSLGAVLFHVLTGKPPFDAPTPLETLRLVTSQDAPDPRSKAPWIDRDLATVCLMALRRERTARYESTAALAGDLECWLRGDPVRARPLGWPGKTANWCRRHPIAAVLTGAAAAGAAVLGVVLIGGSLMLREERNNALVQKAAALTHAAAATRARDDSRLHSYAADIYLAFRAFDDGHLGLARKMLERQRPAGGLPDLRGFEWHALARRCRGDDLRSWHDHHGAVCAVAFSPDGKTLASGSRDGLLVIRTVPAGDTILTLPKPDAPRGVAEIPLLTSVTARSAEAAKIILTNRSNFDDLRMRARPSRLGEITAVAWSPDGSRLATAGLGSYVRVWSVPAGELTAIVPVRTASTLTFTPDGGFLIVHHLREDDGDRHECRIYQTSDFSLHHVITGLQGPHAVSPSDGTLATVAEHTNDVVLSNPSSKLPVMTIQASIPLKRLAFSHDGGSLHGVDRSGATAGTWSAKTGARTGVLFPVAGLFDLLVPSPGGGFFASTGSAQRIAWQHGGGSSPAMLMSGHEDVIRALAISPDGRFLASGGNDHSVRLWDTQTTKPIPPEGDPFVALDPPVKIRAMAGASGMLARVAGGCWIAEKERGGQYRLVSDSGKILHTVEAPQGLFLKLCGSPHNSRLAAFSWPRSVRVLSVDGKSWSGEWTLSPGTVGPVVFSPDGSLLASGGDDNMISIHDAASGALIAQLKGHQGAIIDLAFTSNGRTLASTAEDETLRLWHVPTWRDLGTLHRGERLNAIAFDPEGETLHARSANGIREFGKTGP